MSCCLPSGSMLTRAEREAIAKLREHRAQGRVPISAAHRAPIQRTEPLVTFYQRTPPSPIRPPLKTHITKPPALSRSIARPRHPPPVSPHHSPSRPRHRPKHSNHHRHLAIHEHQEDDDRPGKPLKKMPFFTLGDPNRAQIPKRSHPDHNHQHQKLEKTSPRKRAPARKDEDRVNRSPVNEGAVRSMAGTATTTTTTTTSKTSALGDAIKALSIWHALKTGNRADDSKGDGVSASNGRVDREKGGSDDGGKENAARGAENVAVEEEEGRQRKKGSSRRKKGPARQKWDEVVTRLGGNPAKGERFVIKQKLDASDLAESMNDRYFQELMRSDL